MKTSAYSCPKRKVRNTRTMFGQLRGIQHNTQGPHGGNAQGPRGRRYSFNNMQVKRELIGNKTQSTVHNNKVGIGKYFRYYNLNTSFAEFSKNV